MKHEMKDLFKYNGKIYTSNALAVILKINPAEMKYFERKENNVNIFRRKCDYNTPTKASFTYYDLAGEKVAWQFGEKVFFDTEEERDKAREEHKAIREENRERQGYLNKIMEYYSNMTTEELKKISKNF